MPRRQFVIDLEKAQSLVLPLGITGVKAGDDDGQVVFVFNGVPTPLPNGPLKITALIPELGDYPKSHQYMLFGDEHTPHEISAALNNMRGTDRKTVFEMLDVVSATLINYTTDRDGDVPMADSLLDEEEPDTEEPETELEDEDDGDIYDSDHEAFQDPAPEHTPADANSAPAAKFHSSTRHYRNRARADLRAAKAAGFKVGCLGHLLEGNNAFVSVSIRMSKLGISDEAMQAWQVEPADSLTLIIQYPNGYKTNEEFQGINSLRLSPNLAMRVVAGKSYKPTLQEAIKAFEVARKGDRGSLGGGTELPGPDEANTESSIRNTFISKPLSDLLNERLIAILRYRSAGMPWLGAEGWYREQTNTGGMAANADIVPDDFFEPEVVNAALPDIVLADHYSDRKTLQYSFPLLAMQFLLRHFVRCTEFCLVCHQKLETDVEAIKPYVCDNNLCLFQYMALGFGPSIEHEIIAQPYVVDLLISFCYSSTIARKLKEYPDGLSLVVPPVDKSRHPYPEPYAYDIRGHKLAAPPETKKTVAVHETYEVGFEESKLELLFHDQSKGCPVKRGTWIVLSMASRPSVELHCRVAESTYFPSIKLDAPVIVNVGTPVPGSGPATSVPPTPAVTRSATPDSAPTFVPGTFQVYEQDFQQLDDSTKCLAMATLLDTLPSVADMQTYLARNHPSDLKHWVERLSPAALSLLRWIIASNRACIMQVDGNAKPNDTPHSKTAPLKTPTKSTAFGKSQERLYGMEGYFQFRFAMGAPDKEQRFITAVRQTTARLGLHFPTLFAFHGSPLHNWHMIIREGLHYQSADHGRAYGDGVYHARDAATSTGYSGMYHGAVALRSAGTWPSSALNISSAMALNEIVNAPAEFRSASPYYVVQQLDWIQTRYLFVKCHPTETKTQTSLLVTETMPQQLYPQDPKYTPHGISGNIMIPASAIKSRIPRDTSSLKPSPFKKLKMLGGKSNPVVLDEDDDDVDSVTTLEEDRDILLEEEAEPVALTIASPRETKKAPNGPTTDFVPGTLDFTKLPMMPMPAYASSGTTKRLMKELSALQKIQEATPLAELGWYIETAALENVYQWIVELHSFHTFEHKGKPLPLAADMKKHNIHSVVLEVQFNKDFPFTPPYVRVLRPRFLSLAQGGGGHIVMGGAMCMELLTNTGWSSVSSMESVLMQIRLAIASEPFARLDIGRGGAAGADYGTAEGAEGYIRACQTHGWEVPPGFREMAYGSASAAGASR